MLPLAQALNTENKQPCAPRSRRVFSMPVAWATLICLLGHTGGLRPWGLHPMGRTREGSRSPAAAVVACARDTVTPLAREGAARGGWAGQEVGMGLPVVWVHDSERC